MNLISIGMEGKSVDATFLLLEKLRDGGFPVAADVRQGLIGRYRFDESGDTFDLWLETRSDMAVDLKKAEGRLHAAIMIHFWDGWYTGDLPYRFLYVPGRRGSRTDGREIQLVEKPGLRRDSEELLGEFLYRCRLSVSSAKGKL